MESQCYYIPHLNIPQPQYRVPLKRKELFELLQDYKNEGELRVRLKYCDIFTSGIDTICRQRSNVAIRNFINWIFINCVFWSVVWKECENTRVWNRTWNFIIIFIENLTWLILPGSQVMWHLSLIKRHLCPMGQESLPLVALHRSPHCPENK